MSDLVLSLFPGIGLLDRAFEEAGFCVVRGPDVLWGGDVRSFHPLAGVFDGVIGGPPCQAFSQFVHVVRANGFEPRFGNLIPEFERCIVEATPRWFLMENVPAAPQPDVIGYKTRARIVRDGLVGGVTRRDRCFSFGTPEGIYLDIPTIVATNEPLEYAVTKDAREQPVALLAGGKPKRPPGGGTMPHVGKALPLAEMCRRQGLPEDFLEHAPFTMTGKRAVVGEGVPLPMGRAVAQAVKRALEIGDGEMAQ